MIFAFLKRFEERVLKLLAKFGSWRHKPWRRSKYGNKNPYTYL